MITLASLANLPVVYLLPITFTEELTLFAFAAFSLGRDVEGGGRAGAQYQHINQTLYILLSCLDLLKGNYEFVI